MSICNLDHFAESYWQTRQFGLVGGAFDPLHDGHLAYFDAARAVAPWLVCAVTPDAELRQKRTPFLPERTRLHVLNRCRDIEHVHLATAGIPAVIDVLRPTHYIVGADWTLTLPAETRIACEETHTQIVFVDCRENSSTALLADYERRRNAEKLVAFERFVSQQKPAEKPWEPVTDYSESTRRGIEQEHARIIADAFRGCRVLDYGCGFGYLVDLLTEHDMDAEGWDPNYERHGNSEAALDNTYGLVICREVLEHVHSTHVASTIRDLIALSERFVYLTTRFTTKSHLLDIDGSDDLDPTHISMFNQDYLRSLFVLEGCTRRADLEAKLDWQNKKRVLVYEVPA